MLDKYAYQSVFIKYSDLCELLEHDQKVQGLIRALLQQVAAPGAEIEAEGAEELPEPESGDAREPANRATSRLPDQPVAGSAPCPDARWDSLEELAGLVRGDDELAAVLLGKPAAANPLPELASLIARAAQWERLLQVWDLLANRCTGERRSVSASELAVLQGCQGLHNLIWDQRVTRLNGPEKGAHFDFQHHQRADSTSIGGRQITCCLLPGLSNAAGAVARKALVTTS